MFYAVLGRVVWFVAKRVVRRRAGALARRAGLVVALLAALGVTGAVVAGRRSGPGGG
jgi:hypothetical protein